MVSSLWGNNDPSYHPHDPPTAPHRSRILPGSVVLAASKGKPAKVVVIAAIASITTTSSVDSRSSEGIVEDRLIAAREKGSYRVRQYSRRRLELSLLQLVRQRINIG